MYLSRISPSWSVVTPPRSWERVEFLGYFHTSMSRVTDRYVYKIVGRPDRSTQFVQADTRVSTSPLTKFSHGSLIKKYTTQFYIYKPHHSSISTSPISDSPWDSRFNFMSYYTYLIVVLSGALWAVLRQRHVQHLTHAGQMLWVVFSEVSIPTCRLGLLFGMI